MDAVPSNNHCFTYGRDTGLVLPKKYEAETYRPDYFVQLENLTLVLMEVKKPDIPEHLKIKDELKLLNMMKLSLNMMMRTNVEDSVVVGLLVQGM